MKLEGFSRAKRFVQVGDANVAYVDEGKGDPVLFLHGCPFSSFVWRGVIARLSHDFRCVAPDLLGLGDTETPPDADWSIRSQVRMVLELLDALALERVHVVGHDQGGAVAQGLAAEHPERIGRLVLANAEAYDNWPSAEELPFLRLVRLPLLGPTALWFLSFLAIHRRVLSMEHAVWDGRVLTPDLVRGYVRANLGDRHKRAKMRRYLAMQLDPHNQRYTRELVEGLRRFDHPTLFIWGMKDVHFGPEWAERLSCDIPGAHRVALLPAGHLVMEERPEEFARLASEFLSTLHPAEGKRQRGEELRASGHAQ